MKITIRLWIVAVLVVLALTSMFVTLNPVGITFLQKGVVISSVESDSYAFQEGLRKNMIIKQINGREVISISDYNLLLDDLRNLNENETTRLVITTDSIEIIGLFDKNFVDEVSVKEIPSTKIKTGLDLQGGARALVKADMPLTDGQVDDLIAVSEERLNVYGLTDVKFFKVITSDQDRLMGIEIAGSSPEDLENLIAQQGKFEAKIGDDIVFIGGNEDITHVSRTSSEGATVYECRDSATESACFFRFPISLSEKAAQRQADLTRNLSLNGSYLSKQLDLYLDDQLVNSLNIGADLRGNVATQIQISGSSVGSTREEAVENARIEMKQLQTVLITGSLPYKLEIVKIDRISPNLGKTFRNQLFLAGIFAFIAVSIIVILRYRNIKKILAMTSISLSEMTITLGILALIGHTFDLPSIAGIIATIGTGVDDQLIILDESEDKYESSIARRIKKALFIIVTAFATTFVAMIPLTGFLSFMGIGAASGGLLKGFAITSLIGITVGILFTRPAFADIVRQID